MAQAGKGKLNFRCPSCFMRDLDIDMFYDKDKKEYRGLLPYIGILKKDYLKENGDTTIWRNYKKRYADMCSEILNNMVERGIIKGFTPYYMKNERKNASELAGFEIEFEK